MRPQSSEQAGDRAHTHTDTDARAHTRDTTGKLRVTYSLTIMDTARIAASLCAGRIQQNVRRYARGTMAMRLRCAPQAVVSVCVCGDCWSQRTHTLTLACVAPLTKAAAGSE